MAECERPVHIEYLRLAKNVLLKEIDNVSVKIYIYNENGIIEEISDSENIVLLDRFWVSNFVRRPKVASSGEPSCAAMERYVSNG